MSVLNRSRRLAIAAAAIVTTAGLALTGCSSSGTAASSDSASTLVAYTGQSGDYQINFNPWSPSNIGGIGTIYESLFFITNVNTADPKPLLGKSYEWNADGTQLTIELRDGVEWSDGEPFTAKDVVFTLDMLKQDKSLNSIGYTGTAKAEGDAKVVVSFDEPSFVLGPNLLGKTWIVPEHLWKGIDPATDVMREPVGTGPYTLGNFKAQAFTLTANKDYWGGAPAVKTVRYLSLSGNTAGADALKQGSIDWQTGPVPNMDDIAGNYPGYDGITIGQNQMALITCANTDLGCSGPQTDPAVRHAVADAINRKQLNSLAFANTASDISPTFALTTTQKDMISKDVSPAVMPNSPDTDAAASTLEGAGWKKGSDGIYAKDGQKLSLTVEVVTGWTDYITAIDTMTQQLKAAGIELKAQQSSWNEWTDKKTKGQFQLAIDSLGQGPTANPYYLYNNNLATSNTAKVGEAAATNLSRYSNPDVDAALAKLKAINPEDKAATQPELDTIQQHLVEDMPYIPILTGGTTSEVHTAKFTGWPTQDDLYAFPAIWASPDNAEVFKALKPVKG
ncbi:peptide ABC transporter substrate-binding protein [Curtobacterium citreum]|uniref:ABC transporter substrate-binding protein n=1 Tax=Curtobacterium citreum TaxID=2036 RepID=A0ABT2HLW5_9MICO|nr:ABC transporter substrate-binding protein [Curtobacterium citreum]MCS6524253.1 ABC transporter substrate-binding protein [Curtobacterium citreum]TQJ27551.1 peptide/nickel transport system substrate-binding protein [Curtobacterium citreum]GGL91969.1 peptide ABC transporter substrate-binding protein [Curtobacterium citreum]